jgi:hypothetical protein
MTKVKKPNIPAVIEFNAGEKDTLKADVIASLVRDGLSFNEAEALLAGSNKKKKGKFNTPEMSETDDYTRTHELNFKARAGVSCYLEEMVERIKDVEDESTEVFYVLPVKLSKGLYHSLLASAIDEGMDGKPEWTEQDEIHKLIKVMDVMAGN